MKRVVLLVTVLWLACGGSKRAVVQEPTVGKVITTEAKGGQTVERADLDGDGRPDVYSYYKEIQRPNGKTEKTMVRRTIDVNADGRPDITQHFDESGVLTKEEMDYDYDGVVDCVRTYEKGVVKQEDFSSGFDGKMDVRKVYDKGVLVVKLVDTKRIGRFDEFQYYVKGRLDRIAWDRDGDGRPDEFVENPSQTEEKTRPKKRHGKKR